MTDLNNDIAMLSFNLVNDDEATTIANWNDDFDSLPYETQLSFIHEAIEQLEAALDFVEQALDEETDENETDETEDEEETDNV